MNTDSQPRSHLGERESGGVLPPSPAAPSHSLARFLDTLGIADDLATWRGPKDGECPF